MKLVSCRLHSYKSFLDSGTISPSEAVTIVIGRNNSGKTALIEGLSLDIPNRPHRNLNTVAYLPSTSLPRSTTDACIRLTGDDLRQIARTADAGLIRVPVNQSDSVHDKPETIANVFSGALENGLELKGSIDSDGAWTGLAISGVRSPFTPNSVELSLDSAGARFNVVRIASDVVPQRQILWVAANYARSRIYRFGPERRIDGRCNFGPSRELRQDAANLGEVLMSLQADYRMDELNSLIRSILPDVSAISVAPLASNQVQILAWGVDPSHRRPDLAFPLEECGTGIGQVIALLYILMASPDSRLIVLDEPQTYLHPSAVRSLLNLLNRYPQHQYVISSHSPLPLELLPQASVLAVRKQDGASAVDVVALEDRNQVRALLLEVGVRLSDIFGADQVLWVEGPTEEACFPLLFKHWAISTSGATIVGVVATGDFEARGRKRQVDLIVGIYERLSSASVLIPAALGFVFDREDRTNAQIEEYERRPANIRFIGRRMYENYLLHPAAIVAIWSERPEFCDCRVSEKRIVEYLNAARQDKRFPPPADGQHANEQEWIRHVDAAKVLRECFSHLSQAKVEYDKVGHGVALTEAILKIAPETFDELRALLMDLMGKR